MNLLLKNHQSIGDILMLTACVRDIKRWYPKFNIMVDTSCNVLFENNPYIAKSFPIGEDVIDIKMEYPLIHKIHENDVHFLHGFIDFINKKLSLRVKLTEFKADLYLTEQEKSEVEIPAEPYWVMLAGGKSDFTAKHWWPEAWQEVVDKSKVHFVTIGGKEHEQYHCKLNSVTDMIGKTNIREAIKLIYHSSGVISPVTFAMHTAACFDKPCVVIAGGREQWWWEKYPGHHHIHTMGALDCCKSGGCWKNHCNNKNEDGHQRCLALIDPKKVAGIINEI